MKTVSVEFKKNGKQYAFYENNVEVSEDDYVIVETERGQQLGKVRKIEENNNKVDHMPVVRVATDKDIEKNKDNIKQASEAVSKAQEMANDLGLEMKFIDAFYTFDQKQLFFYFLADARVDFRDLAKNLAYNYKTRIELRQVGARDKAKEVSGVGPCGRQLCCASFLNDLDSVGINMVKNQNLALNPTKINGCCGRLLCCLKYEDNLYTENRRKMPEYGERIKTKDGFEGVVTFLDVPGLRYILTNNEGEKREVLVDDKGDKNEKRKYSK